MKKIDYNLASSRKISPRAFALRAGLLLLVSLLLGGLTVANLVRLHDKLMQRPSFADTIPA